MNKFKRWLKIKVYFFNCWQIIITPMNHQIFTVSQWFHIKEIVYFMKKVKLKLWHWYFICLNFSYQLDVQILNSSNNSLFMETMGNNLIQMLPKFSKIPWQTWLCNTVRVWLVKALNSSTKMFIDLVSKLC